MGHSAAALPMNASITYWRKPLEWFCGELVGMTTRASVLESIGIVSHRRRSSRPLGHVDRLLSHRLEIGDGR